MIESWRHLCSHEKRQNRISTVFIPGMWIKSSHFLCREMKAVDLEGKLYLVAPLIPTFDTWPRYQKKLDIEFEKIVKSKTPTFLILHSASATVGFQLLVEKGLLDEKYLLGVALINPRPHPDPKVFEDPEKMKKMIDQLAGSNIRLRPRAEKLLRSFPMDLSEKIAKAFVDFGNHKKVMIFCGENDNVVPKDVWNEEQFKVMRSTIIFVPNFGHVGGRDVDGQGGLEEIKAKIQERLTVLRI